MKGIAAAFRRNLPGSCARQEGWPCGRAFSPRAGGWWPKSSPSISTAPSSPSGTASASRSRRRRRSGGRAGHPPGGARRERCRRAPPGGGRGRAGSPGLGPGEMGRTGLQTGGKGWLGVILGTGVDIVAVDRVARAVERHGDRFLRRVFTPGELAYCASSEAHRAARLAARFGREGGGAEGPGDRAAGGALDRHGGLPRRTRPPVGAAYGPARRDRRPRGAQLGFIFPCPIHRSTRWHRW